MTIFGWDASHYDGTITTAIAKRAHAEGIVFATHKIGEGTGGDDPEDKTALAAFRDAGIPILCGYHVVRTASVADQIKDLLMLANRDEPWWKDFPGWFWQSDVERWPYDSVPASTGLAFSKALYEETGRQVALYGSHGQYGTAFDSWPGLNWNADYGSNPHGQFKDVYPGDSSRGWYGKEYDLLQYGSNTTIAGLTTCDANAYRGTLAQLTALIEGDTNDMADITQAQMDEIAQHVLGALIYSKGLGIPAPGQPLTEWLKAGVSADRKLTTVLALLGSSAKVEAAIQGALGKLPTGVQVDQATMQAAFVGALKQLAADDTPAS